jgi:hypothetical protein
MPKVTLREARFDEADLSGIWTVLRQAHPVPYGSCSLTDFHQLCRHKWLDNPARGANHIFGWVLDSSTDGIVGFVGMVPVRMQVGATEVIGVCGSSYTVLPAYRAYSLSLYKKLIDGGDRHFLVTTTAGELPSKLNQKMGMKQIPVMNFSQQLLWLVRPEEVVKWALGQSKWDAWYKRAEQFPGTSVMKGVARVCFLKHRHLRIKCPKLPVEPVLSFTKEFDDLWEHNKKDYGIATVRDRAFLTWRHLQATNVVGRISVFACRDNGRMRGYIALQARSQEAGYLRGSYVVTDLFYERARKDVLYNLMNHAFEFARAQGCTVFTVSNVSNEVAEELNRQRPYIRRNRACPYWYKAPSKPLAELCEKEAWWPSGVDGDSNL